MSAARAAELHPLGALLGSKIEELILVLDDLILLLEWDGCHWKDWMHKAREEIRARDFHGVRRLLDAYGGTGSFNDLLIGYHTSAEGTLEQRPGYGHKNQELDRLSTRAYELAIELKKSHSTGA